MDEAPRGNALYRMLAKDYNPKAAEMQICKYITSLEVRLSELEKEVRTLKGNKAEQSAEPAKRGRKPKEPEE